MPNDKKSNTNNKDQVMNLSGEDNILDEEKTAKEEAMEELSEDVKEALGLEEDPKTKKEALKAPAEDLDYIPEDIKDALDEIDKLM